MKEVSCLLCGKNRSAVWAEISANKKRILNYRFVKCSLCDLVFANPQAESEEIENYYKENYYDESNLAFMEDKPYQRFLKRRMKTIRKYKSEGNILEIGCGPGKTLAFFDKYGYSVIGIEPGNCEIVKDMQGREIHVLRGFFPHPEIKGQKFDIVYSWHVIEHISNPVTFLEKTKEHLKPDGILILGTENISLYYILKRKLNHILGLPADLGTSPEHTFFPAKDTLKKMLEKAGFKVLSYVLYDDNVKGHILRPEHFFNKNIRSILHPLNHSRLFLAAICYCISKLFRIGGSKCEVVASINAI